MGTLFFCGVVSKNLKIKFFLGVSTRHTGEKFFAKGVTRAFGPGRKVVQVARETSASAIAIELTGNGPERGRKSAFQILLGSTTKTTVPLAVLYVLQD